MNIVIGEIRHETNTFSNVPTTVEAFKLRSWYVDDDIIKTFRGVRTALGGMIDRADALKVHIVPTFATAAQPSGIITADTFETLSSELIGRLRRVKACDAICLSLHGAGVARGVEDIEGELLARVRDVVGDDMPIVVTLDLHANVTERMVALADAIFGDNEYPHIDTYERGVEAVNTAVDIIKGEARPIMHFAKVPLMIPTVGTQFSPVKEINDVCHQWEGRPGILDCTLFHGFPYSDISRPGVGVLAIADGDRDLARQAAEDVATMVWRLRDEFFQEQPSPSEGVRLALRSRARPVVINEMYDNPGGGSPGDGTRLLSAMIEAGMERACFAPMYDPEVVDIAHEAGVGATIDVLLGGKTDELHGDSLRVKAYVKCLTDGRFVRSSPMGRGRPVNLGKSARIQVDGIDIVVCSVRTQLFDEELFVLHGIDIARYDVVALKSSHHFRARFEQLTDEIISVDAPGLCTLQFTNFPFQRVEGDVYPLTTVDVDEGGTN